MPMLVLKGREMVLYHILWHADLVNFRMALRVSVAVATVAATAIVTLAQLNLPRSFWSPHGRVLYVAVGVLCAAVASQSMESVRALVTSPSIREFEGKLRSTLASGLGELSSHLGIPITSVGIHAFIIDGGKFKPRLANIGGIRLGRGPTMDNPTWIPGKGVVGRSWESGNREIVDWETLSSSWRNRTKSAWDAQSSRDRFGLSWMDFRLTLDYERILAMPIVSGKGQVIGILAVDCPATVAQLEDYRVEKILGEVARETAKLCPPPNVWVKGRL